MFRNRLLEEDGTADFLTMLSYKRLQAGLSTRSRQLRLACRVCPRVLFSAGRLCETLRVWLVNLSGRRGASVRNKLPGTPWVRELG